MTNDEKNQSMRLHFEIHDGAYRTEDVLAIWRDGDCVCLQLRGIQQHVEIECDDDEKVEELYSKALKAWSEASIA